MEPTVRVSIGGIAFILDEEAYRAIGEYLQALKRHFANKSDADEIISDIEARMSELLQMRIRNNNNVITLLDAQEIIGIMGNPKDFGDDIEDRIEEPETDEEKTVFSSLRKKKLYRDPEHKILGGVCSGLGHYFRIDPVAFRLIFVAPVLLPIFFAFLDFRFFQYNAHKMWWTFIVIYIILWVVMPKARSFKEKLAMTGTDPSIENIENRSQPSSEKYRGSFLRDLIVGFFNLIVAFVGIIACVMLIALVIAFIFSLVNYNMGGINEFLTVVGIDNIVNLKVAVFLAGILPLIGICYIAFKLLKRSRFTSGDFIISIVAVCLWIGVGAYLFGTGMTLVEDHKESVTDTQSVQVDTKNDALLVTIDNKYWDSYEFMDSNDIFFLGEDKNNPSLFTIPHIRTKVDSTLTTYKIEIHKRAYSKSRVTAFKKANEMQLDYTLTDSLLSIKPKIYTKENPWSGETFDLTIYMPTDKKVKVEKSLKKAFWRYSNMESVDD